MLVPAFRPERGYEHSRAAALVSTGRKVHASRVGEYEILGEIARGGMGIVYRARHRRLHRVCALKIVAAELYASHDFLERFRTEAEAAASLDHPNIVPIYEVGEWEGCSFFSMRLIEGGTLAQGNDFTTAPSYPAHQAAGILLKLTRAVHYAHQRGILHRDLKPGNVLIDGAGEPYLTDFGLAKLVERESTVTQTTALLGTPSYMPPEQARGGTRGLTTAADIYGLGAILYELLTGRPPFAGDSTLETLRLVLEADPQRPSLLNEAVDRDLEIICLKCLEKIPGARYGSAEALAEDLERWLKGEPIRARPTRWPERVRKWVRRKPAVAALLGGLVSSLVIGFAFASSQYVARNRALIESRQALYAARLGLVEQAWRDGHVHKGRRLLESLNPAPGQDDLRGFEWHYLWRLCRDQSLITLSDVQSPVQSIAVSADGRWIALGGGRSNIALLDARTLEVIGRPPAGNGTRSVIFSPDSAAVVSAGYDGIIRAWEIASQRDLFSLESHSNTVERISYSADGRWIASASRPDGIVKIWDVVARRALKTIRGPGNERPAVAFAPRDELLAWSAGDKTIRLWRPDPWRETAVLGGHAGFIVYLAFSPDGQWMASCDTEGVVKLWSMPDQRDAATLTGHSGWVTSVDFSPDGQRLATTCVDGTIKLWNVIQRKEITTLKGHQMWVNNAVFRTDGHTLLSGSDDRTMKIWSVNGPDQTVPVKQADPTAETFLSWNPTEIGVSLREGPSWDDVSQVGFSADGTLIAGKGQQPVARIWDRNGERGLFGVALPQTSGLSLILSPDGKSIITADVDGKLRLWEFNPGVPPSVLSDLHAQATALAISMDGTQLAAGGTAPQVWLWDLKSRRLTRVYPFKPGFATALAFDSTGRRIVVAMRKFRTKPSDPPADRLHSLELATGRTETLRAAHQEYITGVSFSQDGRWLASSSRSGEVRLWEARSLKPVREWRGHAGYVTSVAFTPDGKTLATAGNDGRVRLWSTVGQQELIALPGSIAPGTRVAFSPDGARLAACGEDGMVRIWRADSGK